jgi:carbon storage regulator
MLILSRKLGESIVIDGRIIVKIVRLEGDIVKLGIDAPVEIPVHRQEVYDEIQRNNREALANESGSLPNLSAKPAASPAPAAASAPAQKPAPAGKAPAPRITG